METVLRVALVYVFILLGLRVLGKREFSQLSPMELVTLLLIPEIISHGVLGEDFSLVNGLVGVSTLMVLVFATSLLAQQSRGFQRAIEGSPTVLVHQGRLLPANLNKERVTPDELFIQLRRVGLERLEQVKWAILETDGKVSVVPAEGQETADAQDDETLY